MLDDEAGPDFPDDYSAIGASGGKNFGVGGSVETQDCVSRVCILSFGESAFLPDIEIAV